MITKPKQNYTRSVFFVLFGIVVALTSCTSAYSENTQKRENGSKLALPYDLPTRSREEGSAFTCPAPKAAAPVDLVFESVYDNSDPYRATPDANKQEAYAQETEESRAFENKLLEMSNGYLKTGSSKRAQCVLDWLYHWAKDDALLGDTNNMGVIVRQWMLASLGSAYAQIRDDAFLNGKKKRIVEKWLKQSANAVIADYPYDATQSRKLNNLLYWAAWSVTITGISLDDRDLYEWGIGRTRNALNNQMKDDGTLPLEMARGQRALHYHIFSAVPLIMLAEAGERNGDPLYKIRDGILHRFIYRVLEGMRDPRYFEAESGVPQNTVTNLHPGHLAWMEPYHSRFPSPEIAGHLEKLRPVFLRRTGGNMTLLYKQHS
jgi:poly(beta-D-mannuronate) lyase